MSTLPALKKLEEITSLKELIQYYDQVLKI